MQATPPKYQKVLDQRNITMGGKPGVLDANVLWPDKLSTCEEIRWAHNTACRVVNTLSEIAQPVYPLLSGGNYLSNLVEIREADSGKMFSDRGMKPEDTWA